MKFEITITEDVISKSLMCGVKSITNIEKNCAFALAFNELVPRVEVEENSTCFYAKRGRLLSEIKNTRPIKSFIRKFDHMAEKPQKRFSLAGQKFEVEIPDEVIDYWYKDASDAAQAIANCKSLKVKTSQTV